MHAVEVAQTGGPEVLQYVDKPMPIPGPDEVLIKADAIGVNHIDTYFRSGQYPRELPFVVGTEVCGTVAAAGDDVAAIKVGDRVVTANATGAYANTAAAPADFVACSESVPSDAIASALLKGMTAHYLIKSVYQVQPGDWLLVHAGAGGWPDPDPVGDQPGCAGDHHRPTPEKAELSRQAGAVEVPDYPDDPAPFGARVRSERRRGVAAAYDGVGRSTFDASLASLAIRGTLALFGASSGPVPPVDPATQCRRFGVPHPAEPGSLHSIHRRIRLARR